MLAKDNFSFDHGWVPGRSRKHQAIVLLFFLLAVMIACRQQVPPTAKLALTGVESIRSLPPDLAGKGLPVKVEAVVTYLDSASNLFFVHDGKQGIYVELSGRNLSFASGSLVELEGKTYHGTLNSAIMEPKVKFLRAAELPRPKAVPLSQLLDGKQDCQWIETQGVVRSLKRMGDLVHLTVADLHAQILVIVKDFPGANANDLVDAQIQLQGVLGTHSNIDRQVIKVQLFVPSRHQFRILDPANPDLKSLPIQSISQILQTPRSQLQPHRVRIQGAALPRNPGQSLMIQDPTGSLEFLSSQTDPVNPGERLDVFGFLAIKEHRLILEDSIYIPLTPPPSPKPTANSLPTLTQVEQIRKLSNLEADQNYPVRIKGVVTYSDPDPPVIFVQDATGGIYIETHGQPFEFKAGHMVEVEGISESGATNPEIFPGKVQDLGPAPFPAAKSISIDQFLYGEADSQRVELEGTVRNVSGDSSHAFLELVHGGIRFPVILPGFQDRRLPTELVDTRVRIRGCAGILFNLKEQINGFQLYTPVPQDIIVVDPAPEDPFSLPVRPINSLINYSRSDISGHRVRIQGLVLHNQLGQFLYIRDSSGPIYIQTRQEIGVVPGTLVDVVGFPTLGNPANSMEDAVFKNLGVNHEVSVNSVNVGQALSSKYHGDLIRIEADLLNHVKTPSGQVLVLNAEKRLFEASLDNQKSAEELPEEGSHLELVGICLNKMESTVGSPFKLLLRTSLDIRVLKDAPWWTSSRMAWALGIFLLGILLSSSWGVTLKQRIKQQTLVIQQRIEREAVLEKEYRDLFENSNDVVFAFDLNGKITSFNKAGELLSGYNQQELLRMNFDQLLAPSQAQFARERIRQKIEGSPAVPFEIELQAKDGGLVTLEVTADVMFREGKAVGLRGIGRDITRRKQAEAALRESEERLRQAQKLEAIGTLAGGIAHDFNNILGAILGYAELTITDAHNPDRILHNQDQILIAGKRARDLVRQILTFSRKLEQERKPIQLQEIIEETSKLLRATLPTTIEIQLKIEPACKPVWADPSQMHQVIMNLGTNAYHAMRPAGGRLTIGLEPAHGALLLNSNLAKEWEGEGVCLWVTDTGHGMKPETLKRIFDPYFTTKSIGDGSGLGLAVVHGIVQSHKGIIQVESQTGQGSTFRIYLPCSEVAAVEEISERPAPPSSGKGNVLFVDDEEAIVDMAQKTLERMGYTVTAKVNSAEALTIFQTSPQEYDVVITDQTMPQLTGMDLAREIKKNRPDLPIILCTGYSEEATPEKALEAGITAYLYKPVSSRDLTQAIQKAIGTDKKS
jgi:PAS domain S-box-containing protein